MTAPPAPPKFVQDLATGAAVATGAYFGGKYIAPTIDEAAQEVAGKVKYVVENNPNSTAYAAVGAISLGAVTASPFGAAAGAAAGTLIGQQTEDKGCTVM